MTGPVAREDMDEKEDRTPKLSTVSTASSPRHSGTGTLDYLLLLMQRIYA